MKNLNFNQIEAAIDSTLETEIKNMMMCNLIFSGSGSTIAILSIN